MDNPIRPKLDTFRLVSATIKNVDNMHLKHRAWSFVIDSEFAFGALFHEDKPARITLNINISINGTPSDDGEGTAEFNAHYQVGFEVPIEFNQEEIDTAMVKDDNLQHLLASQAYLLCISDLRGMVQNAGFDPKAISYTY
ncbi:hypothetical protein [Comamonas sp. BIGb0124]|uniref:hypothetical protein n=1 Tax=Comamonas sp. BIGb0124 TaxID=2485130 RepID=UPI0011CD9692|nr:hypothetical protein [Comamonas sp. BIGb0124]